MKDHKVNCHCLQNNSASAGYFSNAQKSDKNKLSKPVGDLVRSGSGHPYRAEHIDTTFSNSEGDIYQMNQMLDNP